MPPRSFAADGRRVALGVRRLTTPSFSNPQARRFRVMRALAAALLVALCSAWISAGHAAAQLPLGSLVVTITSPAQGSTVGGAVPVVASVSIIGNLTVRDVRFTLDGVDLGPADTTPPYSVSWNTRTTSNGSHTLRAVARDLLGVTYSSSPVAVTVFNDLTPPSVAITEPSAGATVSGTIALGASATDNVAVAGVQFRIDGVPMGPEDVQAPYSASWNTTAATNGPHMVTAVARDAAGNSSTSATITVTVLNDLAPPDVAITAPAAGATVSGSVAVTASASDDIGIAGVQFRLDGANLGVEDVDAPYSASWNTAAAANGSHTLTAVARDASGKTTTSAQVPVTVRNDTQPPVVTITAPEANATVDGVVAVTASASDDIGVTGVQFRIDGANIGAEDTDGPYSASWNTTTVGNGSHTITAVARDASGKSAVSAGVTVTVDNDTTPPTISITSPAPDAEVGGTVMITADASDDVRVISVRFFVDGVQQGPFLTSLPYEVPWDTTTVSDGTHTLAATATDGMSHSTTSAPVTVTVKNATTTNTRVEDTSANIVYGGAWSQGNTARAWSGGTAALAASGPTSTGERPRAALTFNGTRVTWIGFRGPQTGIADVYLDGTLVATVDAYAAAEELQAAMFTASGLAAGSHTIAVEATGRKNASSADIFVVVDAFDVTAVTGPDTTAPTVAITSPADGSTVGGAITIAANAFDDRGVTTVRFLVDGAMVAEDATTPYAVGWDTAAVSEGPHVLTAVAHDAAGHTTTSDAVTVTVSNTAPPPAAAATRFENTDLAITYTSGTPAPLRPPDWFHGSRSRGWSSDTASFNRSDGGRATFAFTGTSVSWIGFRAPWAGIARVHVDGVFTSEVDLFSPTEGSQAAVFKAAGLAPGSHTISVESTGRKRGGDSCTPGPDCASDYAIVVDAFDVAPTRPPMVLGARFEETSPAVQFTPFWGPLQSDGTFTWSGGTAMDSGAQSEHVTFDFIGTTVSWVGAKGMGGKVQALIDGAVHANLDTGSSDDVQGHVYTATNLAPGRHQLKLLIVPGGRVTVDAFDVRSRFEDVDPAVSFTGPWVLYNMDRAWSGTSATGGSGTAGRATSAGASASFTFSGTSVSWIGFRGPLAGIADVYLDGVLAVTVDLYAPAEALRVPVFERSGLTDGPHTLRIEATGQKNPSATASLVMVDAFDVTLSPNVPSIVRFQETATSAAYTGPWTTGSMFEFWSGERATLSETAGARVTFSFNGTGIRWIGERRRTGGIARVSVDGGPFVDVDTFGPVQDEFQAPLFSATGLASGAHTITIEVTGQKRGGDACSPAPSPTCAAGYVIVIDAFEVSQ